jgi:PAS domain S-box-containing protein
MTDAGPSQDREQATLRTAYDALRESEELRRIALESGGMGAWTWDTRERTVRADDAFRRLWGVAPNAAACPVSEYIELMHTEQAAALDAVMRKEIAPGERFDDQILIARGPRAGCWIRWRGRADSDRPWIINGVTFDITENRRTEQTLRESEERMRLIVENAQDYAIFTTDPHGVVMDWREGAENVFGYSREEIEGHHCDILFTPEDRAHGQPQKERSTAAEHGKAADVRWHMHKSGARVFIDGVSTALRSPDGALIGFLKIGQDVTEKHAAGERQELLLAELQHRVRNTLGMIRSMVRFTAEGHDDLEDYLSHLTGRLDSLSRTQQLLTRSSNARVDLHELVSDEMTAQAGGRSAYKIEGPDVTLAPKAAEVLALALHELVTNSVKYGALGDVRGSGAQVVVGWNVMQRDGKDWLGLRWREPSHRQRASLRQGFGTELITQRVPYELRGEATLDIGPHEVAADIAFPLARGPSSLLETGAPPMVTA